jgi:hypothetical protein
MTSVATGAVAGSVVPGAGTIIGTVTGLALQFIGVFAGLFKGRTEEESYTEDILPIIKPYIQSTGIPVAVFHYGYIWVLHPDNNLVSLTGERRVLIEETDAMVKDYADRIGWPVAILKYFGYYLENPWFKVVEPDVRREDTLAAAQAGFGSNPWMLIGAGLLLLSFTMSRR